MLAKNLSLLKSAITASKQDQKTSVQGTEPLQLSSTSVIRSFLLTELFFSTLDSQHFLKTESQTPLKTQEWDPD